MFKSINRKSLVVIIVFVLVLIFAVYTWYGALRWEHIILGNEEAWYQFPELSRMEIKNTYDLAFEKIILVGGFAFSALAFWLKLPEKK